MRSKTGANKGVDVENKDISNSNYVPDTVTRRGCVVIEEAVAVPDQPYT